MKTFATIFNIYNLHLTKDVGLIPYGMSKYYGYDSYCISYDNSPYQNLKYVPGLKWGGVKKVTGNFDFDAFLYLIKHAKEIDVLNVYHQRRWTAIYIFIYKFLNPKGLVYWKLDGGSFDRETSKYKLIIYKKAIKKCALISTETQENARKQSGYIGKKIAYITNPFDPSLEKPFLSFAKKENIILTVGRLGSEQKATDVLMEAFRLASKDISKDWKLRLIGPIEKVETDFQKYIDDWFNKYPEMRKRVEFIGQVSDRLKLSQEYERAKIFAFPSRHEGFGIAMIEAATNGDFMIGSDIPSIKAFTCDFKYAESFPVDDVNELSNKITKCCNTSNEQLEEKAYKLYCHTLKNNSLKNCCFKIQEYLKNEN